MVYYQYGDILVRDMQRSDADDFVREECAQGWHATPDKFFTRLEHKKEGRAIPLVAEYAGHPAGYLSLYKTPGAGPYADKPWPEVVDFAVLAKFRGKGVGSVLMDVAEMIAAQTSDTICIGVGLHNGYGAAQRMYVKRGYVPDGSGVWYRDRVHEQYAPCVNDDDLVLHLAKKLR